ncbi:MAG: PspC domain-containing protein [Candidatus Pacebacteria bacterium]|nr:PspC domain-containing protein [Candidatus Paceibacterota bacterium]
MSNNIKKLYRSKTNRVIFGVCGGLGEYFEIDPLIVRILFIVLSMAQGAGIIAYVILAILVPEDEKKVKKNGNGDGEPEEKKVEEVKDGNWFKSAKNIFGLFIVLIGLNILFEQVFRYSIFSWINWGIVLGLVVILIGARIISKSNKK